MAYLYFRDYKRLIQLDKIGAIVLPAVTPMGQRNKVKTDRL